MDLQQWSPARTQTLFPELPASGARPVEVTVTVPHGEERRTVMHLLVTEDDALRALALAVTACKGVPDFEVTARRFTGE